MSKLSIAIKWLPHGQGLSVPQHATPDSAGLDLAAAIHESVTLQPGQYQLIPTGFCIAIPQGHEGQIRPRSGLAYKQGITILNSPGTIDADHRGEVKVLLINHGAQPVVIERGMRIAQLIISSYKSCELYEIDQEGLDATARCLSGFGSTGV